MGSNFIKRILYFLLLLGIIIGISGCETHYKSKIITSYPIVYTENGYMRLNESAIPKRHRNNDRYWERKHGY
jgi:hypothetical protein